MNKYERKRKADPNSDPPYSPMYWSLSYDDIQLNRWIQII